MPFDPLQDDTTDMGDAIREYQAEQAKGNRFAAERPGDKYIRLLPPIVTDPKERKSFAVKYGVHFGFDELRGLPGMEPFRLVCPQLTLDQECWACRVNAKIMSDARGEGGLPIDPDAIEMAKQTKARYRYLANVIEVTPDNRMIEPRVLIWEFGGNIFSALNKAFADHQKFAPITHPQRGYVLRVVFERSGGRYGVAAKMVHVLPENGPIPVEGWPDMRHDLEQVALSKCPTPQEVRDYWKHAYTSEPEPIASTVTTTTELPQDVEVKLRALAARGDLDLDALLKKTEHADDKSTQ